MTASLIEEFSRELTDGSRTSITMFRREDTSEFIIEAENARGVSSCLVFGEAEALHVFNHPFSRAEWLDYPGLEDHEPMTTRRLTDEEYALAEAMVTA